MLLHVSAHRGRAGSIIIEHNSNVTPALTFIEKSEQRFEFLFII